MLMPLTTLAVVMLNHSVMVSAEIPSSCYWCVSTGSTWDNINNACAKTGNKITKAEECTQILELGGLDYVFAGYYNATLTFPDTLI